jgi:uncharacterized protein (TIGR02646 family)
MRNLTRPDIVPPTLTSAAEKGYAISSGHWRNPDVRGLLRAVQGQSCAYCQSAMEGRGTPGTVDHFRPSSKYEWLAYRIDNLLLACNDCNSRIKNSDFPIDQSGAKAESDDDLPTEPRLLLDPVADPIDQLLDIDYIDERFSFRNLVADQDSIDFRRVRKTIEVLRFAKGADPTYQKLRIRALGAIVKKLDRHKSIKLSADQCAEVKLSACRWQPFGEMVQRLIRFHLPETDVIELCPTAEEECLWLIDDLATMFEEAPTTDDAERQRMEARWCLAALFLAPPNGINETVVRDRLNDLGLQSEIEAVAAQFAK